VKWEEGRELFWMGSSWCPKSQDLNCPKSHYQNCPYILDGNIIKDVFVSSLQNLFLGITFLGI